MKMGTLIGRSPYDGLRYPKIDDKPPFLTLVEIERRLPCLKPAEQTELWNCLFLTQGSRPFPADDGKWQVLKAWHVLRHSFISCCASRGVDQRLIDKWVGHTTEEMRRRYRHLTPSAEKQAIRSVF